MFSENCRDDGDGAMCYMLKYRRRVSLGGFTNWDKNLYIKLNIFRTTSESTGVQKWTILFFWFISVLVTMHSYCEIYYVLLTKFYLSSWNHLVIPSLVIIHDNNLRFTRLSLILIEALPTESQTFITSY
jgi:hypothetical protein